MSEVLDVINVARDFAPYPAGRDDRDGPHNGTRFREEILMPRLQAAIDSGQTLLVSLDGVRSFGSSFLEEAFGGLVRRGIPKPEVRRHLRLSSAAQGSGRYLAAIDRYIDGATRG